MKTKTVNGYYGARQTPRNVFVCYDSNYSWYVVEGGTVVNCTTDEIEDGVDVELLYDVDCFTWNKPVESEEELEEAVLF